MTIEGLGFTEAELSPHYSMLESADDYAHEWNFLSTFCGGNPRLASDISYLANCLCHPRECICNGGLPMIKRDCPRHGHLVRNSEARRCDD